MPRKKKEPVTEPVVESPKSNEVPSSPKVPAGSLTGRKFEPVMYVCRAKAYTMWVNGGKKKVQFNNNGLVGVFIARTEQECQEIEETNAFKSGEVRRANGSVPGNGTPVRVGVRSALEVPAIPVEPEIQKILDESNQAAKRPIVAE